VTRGRVKRGWSVALLGLVGAAPVAAPLEVRVSDVRSDKGFVRVTVCDEAQFLKNCPIGASVPAEPGTVLLTLRGVPPGRYAVQAFHDEDGDGKLATSWFGIPRDGIGFSNDAMPRLMKPHFGKAAFEHGDAGQRVPVRLRYFLG
jgi:uncharacterized protein (DUF2141 family)